MEYEKLGLVINRARDRGEVDGILGDISLDLLGWIPEDSLIREFDFKGKSVIDLPDDSASVVMVGGGYFWGWGFDAFRCVWAEGAQPPEPHSRCCATGAWLEFSKVLFYLNI